MSSLCNSYKQQHILINMLEKNQTETLCVAKKTEFNYLRLCKIASSEIRVDFLFFFLVWSFLPRKTEKRVAVKNASNFLLKILFFIPLLFSKETNVTHCFILMFEFTGDDAAYRINTQRPYHWPHVFILAISPPFPFGLSQCDHWKNRIKRRNPKPKSKKRKKKQNRPLPQVTSAFQSFCIHVSVHTIFFVRPEGLFYVILWSVRSYPMLVMVVGNSRLKEKKKLSLMCQPVYHVLSFSLVVFHSFLCFCSFVLASMKSHTYDYCQAMNAVIPHALWSVEYRSPVWNESLTKQHHIGALILAKTNMKIFSVWNRGEEEPQNESLRLNAFLAHFNPEWSEAGHRCSPSSRDNFTAGWPQVLALSISFHNKDAGLWHTAETPSFSSRNPIYTTSRAELIPDLYTCRLRSHIHIVYLQCTLSHTHTMNRAALLILNNQTAASKSHT